MDTILSAIGSTVADDPLIAGNTGIVRPIDVLCLQEYNAPGTTGKGFADLLNKLYNTTTYQYGALAGATTGTGTQGIVYNSASVSLLSQATVGTSTTSGQPRQTLRYQLRPVGYGSAADVWIYDSHFKAGSDATSANRRNIEAAAIRTDEAANVPAGANVMYVGDFNTYTGTEAMLNTLTAPGEGQAKDPINSMGWRATAAWRAVHTQSPFDTSSGTTGFSGGGMDSRFDFQLSTANMQDGHGVAYIPNSYQAFGNNGTHTLGEPITTGTGASTDVLKAEAAILDHLPVVADYQLPAKMSASVSAVPSRVIVGANVNVTASVSNSAPTNYTNGADTLAYTVSTSGALSGSAAVAALTAHTAANTHTLALDTSAVGPAGGVVNINSTSEAVADGNFSQAISTQVIDHAQPSFSTTPQTRTLTIDFGVKGRGLAASAGTGFSIYNLLSAAGETAKLNLNSISASGDTSALSVSGSTFSNLAAGANSSAAFTANYTNSANGRFTASYTFNVADEDLPGATALAPLTLNLACTVATPGDADLNNAINFDDYSAIDRGYVQKLSGWSNGDFNGDGKIDFDDFALIDMNYVMQQGTESAALAWIKDGAPSDEIAMMNPSLKTVAEHYDQFGASYANAFVADTPEPASGLASVLAALLALGRPKRRAAN